MSAYITGELPTATQRFISRQIDEDERCYDEYIRQRQTKNELERELSILGRANETQLNNIWANIQAELKNPTNASSREAPLSQRPQLQFSYGVIAIVLFLFAIVPLTFNAQPTTAQSVPTQPPLPEVVVTAEVQQARKQATINPTFVAIADLIVEQETAVVQTASKSTPVPDTPGT